MLDLCNSTKRVCLTGMFIALRITPTLPSGTQNNNVFKEPKASVRIYRSVGLFIYEKIIGATLGLIYTCLL